MTTKNPIPAGEICLKDYWWESASGHAEASHKAVLLPNGLNSVVLVEEREGSNVYKASDKSSSERWAIDVEKLIQLIRENGTKLN